MYVVSTGVGAPTKQRCLESVASQVGVEAHHLYIEDPQRSQTEVWWDAISGLPANAVVAMVDGDDWLVGPDSLAIVQAIYDADPELWLTYGSWVYNDGRRPSLGSYAPGDDVREAPWRATHLKTFKAGLFQRLDPGDLRLRHGTDQVIMLPMIEMAGLERTRFVDQPLYVYNRPTSFEFRASAAEKELEKQQVEAIRRRPPYARLEAL